MTAMHLVREKESIKDLTTRLELAEDTTTDAEKKNLYRLVTTRLLYYDKLIDVVLNRTEI